MTISKRKRITCCLSFVFLALLLTLIGCFSASDRSARQRFKSSQPNVIVIFTDDMGYGDIASFGGNLSPTPNIDRLAAGGLRITNFYSVAPICSPSRAGLITGTYPGRWNFSTYLDNKKHNIDAEQADFLDPEAPSIGKLFKGAGYSTAHIGKWHMGGGRDVKDAPGFERYGFDEHVSTYESPDPDPALTATNWIWSNKDSVKRWDRTKYFVDKTLAFMKKNKGTPCFVNLWPDDLHTPWVPRKDHQKTALYPKNPEEEAAFKLVLEEYDIQIGRLLDGLKEQGQDQNTIVIFTSDNGPLPSFRGSRTAGLRGTKLSLYEGGIRMPFIISWPGHIAAGSTDEKSEVNAIDLLPSLSKMAGITLPESYKIDGIDRSSIFLGEPGLRDKDMYWEYGRNSIAFNYPGSPNRSPNLAVRSGQWKYLVNNDGTNEQLYDLENDRTESLNLSATHPEKSKELKVRLMKWWMSLPKLKS